MVIMAPEEYLFRIKRLRNFNLRGLEPFPTRSQRTHAIGDFLDKFLEYEQNGAIGIICGRIMSKRGQGGMVFCGIKDASGIIQIVFKKDVIGEQSYQLFLELFDIGDFIEAKGTAFHTKRGEPSIFVKNFRILAKSLLPLPDKWHGLKDIETRFRKRYLDLLMNDEVAARMVKRSKIISAMRNFLDSKGFIEVETPTLQPIYGGGFARPFKTHHNALGADFFLRISDEMYLKRLIVGGFEKIYEITKVFRNEGIDHAHNPEFTMFEAQIAYENYEYGMNLFEEIIETVAIKAIGSTEVKHGELLISVKRPWKKIRLIDALTSIGGLSVSDWNNLKLFKKELSQKISNKKIIEMNQIKTAGELTAFAFEELVEEKLIQPTIIYDFPVEVSPLAKKTADPRFTERFEVFAMGSEIGNNYSELNDPIELEKRFMEEKKKEEAGFEEAHQTDYDYIESIRHGMPPACGLGIGIDRLIMLLTGVNNIKEVILFPTLRSENTNNENIQKEDAAKKRKNKR